MERLQILLKLYPKYVNELNKRTYLNAQLKWELLKYKIQNQKITTSYCKQRIKRDERERKYRENKLKNLENVVDNDDKLESFYNIKDKIEEKYEKR